MPGARPAPFAERSHAVTRYAYAGPWRSETHQPQAADFVTGSEHRAGIGAVNGSGLSRAAFVQNNDQEDASGRKFLLLVFPLLVVLRDAGGVWLATMA